MKRTELWWQIADELRGTREGVDMAQILKTAVERGLQVDLDQVRDLMLHLDKSMGQFFVPRLVSDALLLAVEGRKVAVLCDPWAGMGLLALELAQKLHPEVTYALCEDARLTEVVRMLDSEKRINWIEGWPIGTIESVPRGEVDFVASILPMGRRWDAALSWEKQGLLGLKDDVGSLMVFYASRHLAKDGLAAYVVPEGFISFDRHSRTRAAIVHNGMRFKAVLTLPVRAFYPFTAIRTCLVLVENGAQGPLFVGQLSEDQGRNAVLFSNLRAGRESREVTLGKLVDLDSYRGFSVLEADFRVHQIAEETGLRLVRLGEIAEETNLTKAAEPPGFTERPNAIYLPLIGRSDVVASPADLKLKPHNYVQVVLKPDIADSRYLAAFLNTPTGVYLREQACSGRVIPNISKSTVAAIPVLLPDAETQRGVLTADSEVGRLINELSEVRERLWANPQLLDEHRRTLPAFGSHPVRTDPTPVPATKEEPLHLWLENLPFPLASVLWRYHASGESSRDRFELLLQFFEAVTEFQAILLLSAFRTSEALFTEVRRTLGEILKRSQLSFERSTFGTWKAVVEYLSKRGRTMLNGKAEDRETSMDLFRTRDTEVLGMLFSPGIVAVIQKANCIRNSRISHRGAISERFAAEWHASLLPLLELARAEFGLKWCNYELVQPLSCQVLEGAYRYEALRLMGSRAPFEKVQRHTADRLLTKELYVLSKDLGRALPLLPLVKVGPSPVEESNSCFFFNRRENGKLRFVSYHFEQRPELVEDFPDAKAVLDMLADWP